MLKLPIAPFSRSGFLLGAGLALAAAAVKILLLGEQEEGRPETDQAREESEHGAFASA